MGMGMAIGGALAAPAPGQSAGPDRIAPDRLPRLAIVGEVPRGAPHVDVTASGEVFRDGQPLSGASASAVCLRADRACPAAAIGRAVETLRARGVQQVAFVARGLRDDALGALVLRLPSAAEPQVSSHFQVELHRRRAGVHPDSLDLPLRRLLRGHAHGDQGPLCLGIQIPGDATYGAGLQLLAVAARAGVTSAAVTWDAPPAGEGGAYALDLGPWPEIPIMASSQPVAAASAKEVGIGFDRAPLTAPPSAAHGGAGGRYGGRGGNQRVDPAAAPRSRLLDSQAAPWSAGAPRADTDTVRTAALASLAILSGSDIRKVSQPIGTLLSAQAADGRLGAGDVLVHSMATLALVEAFGLSGRMELRAFAEDAITWLAAQRGKDGGWGPPGSKSDTVTTAYCLSGFSSARFFGIDTPVDPVVAAGWFDRVDAGAGVFLPHPGATAEPTAVQNIEATGAALFALYFAGRDPKADPRMGQAAEHLRTAAPKVTADMTPLGVHFVSMALYQSGGRAWKDWTKQLTGVMEARAKLEGLDDVAYTALIGSVYYRYTRLIR